MIPVKTLDPERHYFSIGEMSDVTGVKPYILRYWEKEFGLIRPVRRESGHRKFTHRDLNLICQIKDLVYEKGYSVRGAKKHLWHQARKGNEQMKLELEEAPALLELIKEVKRETQDLLHILSK